MAQDKHPISHKKVFLTASFLTIFIEGVALFTGANQRAEVGIVKSTIIIFSIITLLLYCVASVPEVSDKELDCIDD